MLHYLIINNNKNLNQAFYWKKWKKKSAWLYWINYEECWI